MLRRLVRFIQPAKVGQDVAELVIVARLRRIDRYGPAGRGFGFRGAVRPAECSGVAVPTGGRIRAARQARFHLGQRLRQVAAGQGDPLGQVAVPRALQVAHGVFGESEPAFLADPVAATGVGVFQPEMACHRGMDRQLRLRERGHPNPLVQQVNRLAADAHVLEELRHEAEREAQVRMVRGAEHRLFAEALFDQVGDPIAAGGVARPLPVHDEFEEAVEMPDSGDVECQVSVHRFGRRNRFVDQPVQVAVAHFGIERASGHEPGGFVARMRLAGERPEEAPRQQRNEMPFGVAGDAVDLGSRRHVQALLDEDIRRSDGCGALVGEVFVRRQVAMCSSPARSAKRW